MHSSSNWHPFGHIRVWSHLGWRDVQVRYSETTLGPFWSVSALFAVVFGSSLAVSVLTNQPLFQNSTTLALKLTLWTLILNSLTESSELFHAESALLLNSNITEAVLVLRMVWRNYVFFLHNLIVVLVFFLLNSPSSAYRVVYLVPFGILVALLMTFPGLVLARVGARYRDLRVLVPSFLQLVFFLSPILWVAPDTGPGRLATNINPVAWVVETGYDIAIDGSLGIRYGLRLAALLFAVLGLFDLFRRRATSVRNIL